MKSSEHPHKQLISRRVLVTELVALYMLPPAIIFAGIVPVGARWAIWAATGACIVWLVWRLRPSRRELGITSWPSMRIPTLLVFAVSCVLVGMGLWEIVRGGPTSSVSPFVVATFYACISVPLQEMFFRGFFFFRYEKYLGSLGTIVGSGILFGFYHVIFGLTAGTAIATLAGFVLATVFRRTRNLAIVWVVHYTLGVLAYAAGFAHFYTTLGRPG